MGAEIIDTNLSSDEEPVVVADSVKAAGFHYVIDNWSKSAELAAMVIDIAKQSNAKQYMFVSSAGMYKGGNTSPITEDDTVKTNGAREVEQAVVASGIPYTFMRPQYIYGPLSNKKYLDYFIGRAMRKLPIPLPLHGEQLVCLTNIVDVASLLACATGNEKAMNQIFNCGSDR